MAESTDYLVVEIRATQRLPQGWEAETEQETERRAHDLFQEVCGHPGAVMTNWYVGG